MKTRTHRRDIQETPLSTCTYHKLLSDLAFYSAGEWRPATDECRETPSHYTCVGISIGDYSVDLVRNVCTTHEPSVHTVPGWRWSRPMGVTR